MTAVMWVMLLADPLRMPWWVWPVSAVVDLSIIAWDALE